MFADTLRFLCIRKNNFINVSAVWSALVARPFSLLHIQTIKILRWGRPGNEAGAVTMIAEQNSTAFLSLLLTVLPPLPSCTLSIYPPPRSIPSLSLLALLPSLQPSTLSLYPSPHLSLSLSPYLAAFSIALLSLSAVPVTLLLSSQ